MKKIVILLALLPLMAAAQPASAGQQGRPRNVIFVVGDGMGVAQVYSSIVAEKGKNSVFYQFPFIGFSITNSLDNYTTDSGAGGTALMTGHKVANKHIAKGPKGVNYSSFLTVAKHVYGKAAGFVVTSSVLDATPASTYAHVADRHSYDSISMQMALCPFDVMIGGGKNHFLPANRKDGQAPLDTLGARGYEVAFSLNQLYRMHGNKLVGLLSAGNPQPAPDRGKMLLMGTLKAIETLNRSNEGFVLMVEGSQIDWANHNKDAAHLAAEMADFESMLKAVMDFAKEDGNTLVVVTADHESGGLTLPGGDIATGQNQASFSSSGGHTGVMVPVFAYGPGAEAFAGIQQNVEIAQKMFKILGL